MNCGGAGAGYTVEVDGSSQRNCYCFRRILAAYWALLFSTATVYSSVTTDCRTLQLPVSSVNQRHREPTTHTQRRTFSQRNWSLVRTRRRRGRQDSEKSHGRLCPLLCRDTKNRFHSCACHSNKMWSPFSTLAASAAITKVCSSPWPCSRTSFIQDRVYNNRWRWCTDCRISGPCQRLSGVHDASSHWAFFSLSFSLSQILPASRYSGPGVRYMLGQSPGFITG